MPGYLMGRVSLAGMLVLLVLLVLTVSCQSIKDTESNLPADVLGADVQQSAEYLLAEIEQLTTERNYYAVAQKASSMIKLLQHDNDLARGYYLRGLAQKKRRNYSQAFADFEVASSLDSDSTDIMREYGNALATGYSGESAWEEGRQLLLKAAMGEDVEAQYQLGVHYLMREQSKFKTAIGLLQQAADSRHIRACLLLAKFFQQGRYVKRNWPQALEYYQILAAASHPEGLYYLALAYRSGRGLEQNVNEYQRLMSLAAAEGHLTAMAATAVQLSGKDDFKATKLFFRAADFGHIPAQINLGLAYLRGFGIRQNFSAARYWLNSAGDVSEAEKLLGVMAMAGLGGEQQLQTAYQYFQRSSTSERGRAPQAQSSIAYMAVLAQQGLGDMPADFYPQWQQQLSELQSEADLNEVVWALSTNSVAALNRPEIALQLATRLQQLTQEPAYLDSVAAALARNGDFDQAKKLQKTVVRALKGTREYKQAVSRYKGYKRNQPWAEDYTQGLTRPPASQRRMLAVFSGEAIRYSGDQPMPMMSIGNAESNGASLVGASATTKLSILVQQVHEGQLPYVMREYANFSGVNVELLRQFCDRGQVRNEVANKAQNDAGKFSGIRTYRLFETLGDTGWQYDLQLQCSPNTSV
ncbi:MAG: sel1 repeat family protein [Pseudomonadales bacterium]|nr:sel1 repeat family protein [Pseudomonadales bacterium]